MSNLNSVCIVILNWNGCHDTLECLASLRKANHASVHVIVVDNASTDGSPKSIRQEYPDVELVENKINHGFAGGNNIGIQKAMERGVEFILLLNNDTIVDVNFLDELMPFAARHSSVDIFGPKVLSYQHPDRIWFAGPKRSWIYGRRIEAGHRGFGDIDSGQYDKAEEVGFISGCAMLLRRTLVERIGLLDPEYFAYFEDIDYCLRAKDSGCKLLYVPQARVWHKAATSSSDGRSYSALTTYLGVRNRLLFMSKRGGGIGWILFLPAFCAILFRTWIVCGCRPGAFHAIAMGVVDFLKGRFGTGSMARFTGKATSVGRDLSPIVHN